MKKITYTCDRCGKENGKIKEEYREQACGGEGSGMTHVGQGVTEEKNVEGIIKVSTNLEVSTHTFPEGTLEEQRRQLCALIGNGCTMLEMVRPRRLYGNSVGELGCTLEVLEKGKSKAVGMLVDEEFLCRDNKPEINMVGSYLYESDKHGSPILGNVLFVGLAYGEDGGVDFTGIEEGVFEKLSAQLLMLSLNLKYVAQFLESSFEEAMRAE